MITKYDIGALSLQTDYDLGLTYQQINYDYYRFYFATMQNMYLIDNPASFLIEYQIIEYYQIRLKNFDVGNRDVYVLVKKQSPDVYYIK